MSHRVELTLPNLKEDLDLDCIDSQLIWLQGEETASAHSCGICGRKCQCSQGLNTHLAVHSNDESPDHWLQLFTLPMTADEVISMPYETMVAKYNLNSLCESFTDVNVICMN